MWKGLSLKFLCTTSGQIYTSFYSALCGSPKPSSGQPCNKSLTVIWPSGKQTILQPDIHNTPAVFRILATTSCILPNFHCILSAFLSAFLCNSDSPNNGSGNMIKFHRAKKEYFKVILGYRIIVCNCLFCASASK